MDLAAGMYVTPNVCLIRQVGEGGMGSVWLAEHQALHTHVAVKFVSAELAKTEPLILERFKREAALCAQIKSPYVVQTYDHGVMADGRPYIVMELLEGESLQDRLNRSGPLSFTDTRTVISQTCKALTRAHKLGIVHRDIKPDNLFLTPDEDGPFLLKVLDFGIAKQTGLSRSSKMTSTGSMVGTPEYMSPEQVLKGEAVDFRSDLWAVAVVAYHCLTGNVPFQAETLGSLCVAIANARFKRPGEVRTDLPPSVDAWFKNALALEPSERNASAKELAQTFALALLPGEISDDPSLLDGSLVPLEPLGFGMNAGQSSKHRALGLPSDATVAAQTHASHGPGFKASNTNLASSRGRTVALGAVAALALGSSIVYFYLSDPHRGARTRSPRDAGGNASETGSAQVLVASGAPPVEASAIVTPRASASGSGAQAPIVASPTQPKTNTSSGPVPQPPTQGGSPVARPNVRTPPPVIDRGF